MIRYIYDKDGHEITATASGNASEISAEIGVLISISYNLIGSRSPEVAETFKQSLIVTLLPDSPVWDKEAVPDPDVGVKMVRISDR